LGVSAGNSWLSEYPCRNWLVETIGRTQPPPPPPPPPFFYYILQEDEEE
jgi:hypothetical protein